MSRPLTAVLLAAVLNPVPPVHAGNNFGGSAALSWSGIAEVSDLPTVPVEPVPLYLLLTGIPDVRSLAVELKWSPNDLVGPCYYLIPMDSSATSCGWTSYLQPPGVFEEDSSYTWMITFDGAPRSCVVFMVGGDYCEGRPASFCLMSVKTVDSDGAVDELTVLGGATILGGVEDGCPVVAQDIFPHVAVLGRENTFTIQGRDLSQDTQIALVDDGIAAAASSVVVAGDTTATATVPIPSSFAGPLDVIVSTSTSSDTLANRVLVADSSAGLAPVWQLDVTQVDDLPRARVVANEFVNTAYLAPFPIRTLPIKRRVETAGSSGDRTVPVIGVDVAPLDFDTNGRPAVSHLAFVSSSLVSVNPQTGNEAILASPGLAGMARPLSPQLAARTVSANLRIGPSEEFLGWERSPTGQWLVVHTSTSTQFFVETRTEPVLRLAGRSYDGVFSKDGKRYAAVVDDERLRRWIVVSADGAILKEGAPSEDSMSQLELSPRADVLTFTRERSAHVPPTIVAVNLATGEEHVLSIMPDGTRYYSADGRTVLVLSPSPGSLRLFDVTDPLNPVEVAPPFEAPEGHFITGAVSNDGMLVALQMLERDENPMRTLTRVIALDRNLQQRAVVATRTQAGGLQFEGHFLLSGTQRHPIPTYFIFNPTTQIRLYDLGGL